LKNLREGFTTATDLADTLVRNHGLPFRQAHDIIVDVVINALERGVKAEEITPEMVEEASEKATGRRLTVSANELKSALDPYQNLKRRNTEGGPAPEAVKKMMRSRRKVLAQQEKRRAERLRRLDESRAELDRAEKKLYA